MLFVYFGIMIILSVAETLSTAVTMDQFAWNAQKVYNRLVFACDLDCILLRRSLLAYLHHRRDGVGSFAIGLFQADIIGGILSGVLGFISVVLFILTKKIVRMHYCLSPGLTPFFTVCATTTRLANWVNERLCYSVLS